jgi:site-specific DNA-adenine methylase
MSELKAPFPYFGGKRRAAPIIWRALGDPAGYVEPFAGSLAVLLARPDTRGRRVETVNDADGWLINTWRAIQHSPADVARHAWGPVTEIDYHARLAWLQERRGDDLVSWLEGDPEAHDAKAAGWWLYVAACGISDPWGKGPWRVIDGRLINTRKLPHLGDAGRGVNRKLPHLGDAGQGVNRGLPHLGNAGQGVNRELPHLGNAGQGRHETAILRYLTRLSWRLERTRITCGDWRRVLQPSVYRAGYGGDSARAILLDPPYATSGDLYATTNTDTEAHTISTDVREWCANHTDTDLRIVLCGYSDEHADLEPLGWRKITGAATTGGYSSHKADSRERLWLSPACLGDHQQDSLFGGDT